jgi:hypothetical protein
MTTKREEHEEKCDVMASSNSMIDREDEDNRRANAVFDSMTERTIDNTTMEDMIDNNQNTGWAYND